jgi:predicted transcriptional regulator
MQSLQADDIVILETTKCYYGVEGELRQQTDIIQNLLLKISKLGSFAKILRWKSN